MADNEFAVPLTKVEAGMCADALRYFALMGMTFDMTDGRAKGLTTLAEHIESVVRGQDD